MSASSCSAKGCPRDARWVPKLHVPAQFVAIDKHQPVTMVANLPLCEGHMATLRPKDLATVAVRKRLRDLLADMGRQPPDFARAWISRVPVGSDEHRASIQ